MRSSIHHPRVIVIAGPNGSGKTTFAREYLPRVAGITRFVNANLIAGGLSPLRPEVAAVAAARLFLSEKKRLACSKGRLCVRDNPQRPHVPQSLDSVEAGWISNRVDFSQDRVARAGTATNRCARSAGRP